MDIQLIEDCRIRVANGVLEGAPICFKFESPLADDQLQRFIKYKLRRWCRIWGNPLWRGRTCQLYGLDLTDNARIDIQMEPNWFTLFIQDAPVFVVTRFIENVKHYLSPHFTVYAGDKELVRY